MSSPVYDGKGQPPVAHGWFAGFTEWWHSLTPKYVTHSSGVSSAVVTNGSPKAPLSAPGKSVDSSGTHSAATGLAPDSAPGATKP